MSSLTFYHYAGSPGQVKSNDLKLRIKEISHESEQKKALAEFPK
jgi:hypothetical protein